MSISNDVDRRGADPRLQCIIGVLMLVVCGVFATQLGKIYVEPRDAGLGSRGLPHFVLMVSAALAGVQLMLNLPLALRLLPLREHPIDLAPAKRIAALTVIAFGYIWAITLFQYALPTGVAMSALLYLFGSRGFSRLVLVPIIAVALYWVIFFVLLGIFEEPGRILKYDSYALALRARQLLGLQ